MKTANSFAEAARRAFDNLSLELQRSSNHNNFAAKLEEFLKILDNMMSMKRCEFIRIVCVVLSMDTISVSSKGRTIAYRLYRTPVQYSIHYLY